MATDLIVASLCWVLAYWLRFYSGLLEVDKGVPPFADYLRMLIFVWLIWAFVFRRFGLYRPMRGASLFREGWMVAKANSLSVILLLAVTYLFREKSVEFSRLVFGIFLITSLVGAVLARMLVRGFLRSMRRKGHNLRYAIIVGAGDLAANVAERMRLHPEYGIELLGCLANEEDTAVNTYQRGMRIFANGKSYPIMGTAEHRGSSLESVGGARMRLGHSTTGGRHQSVSLSYSVTPLVAEEPGEIEPFVRRDPQDVDYHQELPVIGSYADLPYLLSEGGIDQVIIALPLRDHNRIEEVVTSIGDLMVDVKVVPDLHRFIQLGSQVEEFDGLPVVSLASTPLIGFNRVAKRVFDLFFGVVFLVITMPIMLVTALLIKLTSRGPVFFSQERMGLDGQTFRIYKFRTMYLDAEAQGARFATRGDPRVMPLGRMLRRLSIDELPQLFNVLRGHMSLVGPRPERPVFINKFRQRVPRYMLRHKVQAGMTGWAQVNGWRGDTSIERRIEHDLYYIENWSIPFDMKIILMTVFTAIFDRNAY